MRERRLSLTLIFIVAFVIFGTVGLILTYNYRDAKGALALNTRHDKTVQVSNSVVSSTKYFPNDIIPKNATINGHIFDLEIVDNIRTRTKGLSDRNVISDNTGMLFVFPSEGLHKFWMKNVHFPLDLLYVSADHRIIDIQTMHPERNVTDARLAIYTPPIDVPLALEVPGGTTSRLNIKVGMLIQFE